MGLLMFGRTPLITSDVKLRRAADRLGFLPQPLTEVVGLVLALLGLVAFPYLAIDVHRGMGTVQPRDVLIVIASMIGIVALHELAHALTLLRFGGRVHELGVAVLCFLPIVYTDVTDMWTLPNRRQQVRVVLAGIIVQLQVSAGLVVAYALLPGHLKESLGTTITLIASANMAAILINLNPLLKLDGYWLIAVLTANPNLQAKSIRAIPELFRRRSTARRSVGIAVFGAASIAYAVFLVIMTVTTSVAIVSAFGWWVPALLVGACVGSVAINVSVRKRRRHG
jgi:putative peptide zinc metalloprotease protein